MAAATQGLQRQCQAFQLVCGPPCTHSSRGAGVSGRASCGSTSQARSAVPSSAVVCTSVRLPGSAATCPGAGSVTGCCPGVAASRRTGVGGLSTAERNAYRVPPSGLATTSVYAPDAVSPTSSPLPVESRKTGACPASSAVNHTTGEPSSPGTGETTGEPGHCSKSGSRSRPGSWSSVASASHSVASPGLSQVIRRARTQTRRRLSGVKAGAPNSASGDSSTRSCFPVAASTTTTASRISSGSVPTAAV